MTTYEPFFPGRRNFEHDETHVQIKCKLSLLSKPCGPPPCFYSPTPSADRNVYADPHLQNHPEIAFPIRPAW